MGLLQIQKLIETEKEELNFLANEITLAESFLYYDFIWDPLAIKNGIRNIPEDPQTWRNIEELSQHILQPIFNQFGPLKIISGFRTDTLNRIFNGRENSGHLYGTAVDFIPYYEGVSLYSILHFIESKLEYRELIAEFFPMGWIHVSYLKHNNSMHLKLKDIEHNYERVSLEYIDRFYSDL